MRKQMVAVGIFLTFVLFATISVNAQSAWETNNTSNTSSYQERLSKTEETTQEDSSAVRSRPRRSLFNSYRSRTVRSPFTKASEKPDLTLRTVESEPVINTPCSLSVQIPNFEKVSTPITIDVDWGDGNNETIEVDTTKLSLMRGIVALTHSYGQVNEMSVNLKVRAGEEESDTITAVVNVKPLPAVLSIKNDSSRNQDNGQIFTIICSAGSFPLDGWKLDFGDEDSTSGIGEVAKRAAHYYKEKGDYTVTFSAKDIKGNAKEETLGLTIESDGGWWGSRKFEKELEETAILSKPVTKPMPTPMPKQMPKPMPASNVAEEIAKKETEAAAKRLARPVAEPAEKNIAEPKKESMAAQVSAEKEKPMAPAMSTKQQIQKQRPQFVVKKSPIISIKPSKSLYAGRTTIVLVTVNNTTNRSIPNASLSCEIKDEYSKSKTFPLSPNSSKTIKFKWKPKGAGSRLLSVQLDAPPLSTFDNNTAAVPVHVKENVY